MTEPTLPLRAELTPAHAQQYMRIARRLGLDDVGSVIDIAVSLLESYTLEHASGIEWYAHDQDGRQTPIRVRIEP